jgi:hypothetical protein
MKLQEYRSGSDPRHFDPQPLHCKSVPAQSQMWHTIWQNCLKWRTISHMCQIWLTIFLTHGVPNRNTPQVKPTEDNCEAYFTQHVSNVTLCRCQIYSVVNRMLINTVENDVTMIWRPSNNETMSITNVREVLIDYHWDVYHCTFTLPGKPIPLKRRNRSRITFTQSLRTMI